MVLRVQHPPEGVRCCFCFACSPLLPAIQRLRHDTFHLPPRFCSLLPGVACLPLRQAQPRFHEPRCRLKYAALAPFQITLTSPFRRGASLLSSVVPHLDAHAVRLLRSQVERARYKRVRLGSGALYFCGIRRACDCPRYTPPTKKTRRSDLADLTCCKPRAASTRSAIYAYVYYPLPSMLP